MNRNLLGDRDVPIGMGMALAQNVHSMQYFSSLGKEQQQEIISQTQGIQSKEEMQEFVDNLSKDYLGNSGLSDRDTFI